MRVTNNLIYDQSSRVISRANDKILNIQGKIGAQTNIVKPSDNPVGASQVLMYEGNNNRLKQFDEAIVMANGRLEYQEVALESLNDAMDDVRTLFIQGQNDVNTQDDLDAIIQEISLITGTMAELMNSKSADGNYIFGGTDTMGPPFIINGEGRYEWVGNEGQKFAQISEDMKVPVSDSGKKLFQDVWTSRSFTAEALLGDVKFTAKVANQRDFDEFMEEHYDPEDPSLNQFQFTTFPILQPGETAPALDATLLGSDTKADQDRRRGFDGTPGTYAITNSKGEVVDSGKYIAGKPINFGGMSFLVRGAPGAVADFQLDKPVRDNVLNQINDAIAVLKNKDSTPVERARAFFNATSSLNNAQEKVGDARSSVGARLNVLRDRASYSLANQLTNATAQDRIAGIDMAEAATELSIKESALTASQKVFTRMSNLSLFNKM